MDEQTTNRILKTIEASSLWKFGLIVFCAFVLIVVVKNVLPWLSKRLEGHKRVYVLMLIPFLRIFIITGAVVLSVPLFIEPSFQNMIAILGSVGLALGFALKDYASSLIAGIIVVGERNYRNGDWVTIEGIYGMVKNTGLRTVEIVTPDDNRVLIPHKLVWNKPVSNANDSRPRLQCIADYYLHPDHDGEAVSKILYDVATTSPYLHLDSPIDLIVNEETWATHYRLKAYPVDCEQQFRFISDMTIRGKAALLALGVNFPNFSQEMMEKASKSSR